MHHPDRPLPPPPLLYCAILCCVVMTAGTRRGRGLRRQALGLCAFYLILVVLPQADPGQTQKWVYITREAAHDPAEDLAALLILPHVLLQPRDVHDNQDLLQFVVLQVTTSGGKGFQVQPHSIVQVSGHMVQHPNVIPGAVLDL